MRDVPGTCKAVFRYDHIATRHKPALWYSLYCGLNHYLHTKIARELIFLQCQRSGLRHVVIRATLDIKSGWSLRVSGTALHFCVPTRPFQRSAAGLTAASARRVMKTTKVRRKVL